MAGKTVVVGVDGSPAATRAAMFGWQLARAAHADCRFVHVIPDTWLSDYAGQPVMGARPLLEEVIEHGRERMAEVLAAAVPPAGLARIDVRVGRPAVGLRAAAEERNAAYVVVGGKHHTAVGRAFAGSTAQDLVRTLDRPLIAVGERDAPVRRVLVALDLSAAARPTLLAARRLARLWDAELRVLHVVEPVRVPVTIPFVLDEVEITRQAEAAFARLARAVSGTPRGEWVVRRGTAVQVITDLAAEWAADLVVVGSHGKGWVDRVLIGSATERLLAALPAAICVIPTGRRATRGRLPRKVGARPQRRRRHGVAA